MEIIETNPMGTLWLEVEVDMDIENKEGTHTIQERFETSISSDGIPKLWDHLGGDWYAELE